ncbi:GAGA Associated Factor [Ephemera danica]|nr:GAGA Associated Factor [Ephemera danica]
MGSSQLYSLTWGEFGTSLVSAVQLLRSHNDLVDVTLAAGGRSFPAHKIVLSAASPFLLDLLKSTPCQHPVLLLAGVNATDLEALLEFVYRGEVSVDPSQLPSLLQAAHCLNIQGLAPGALHPDAKGDEPTALGVHPALPRDAANTFAPLKRKRRGKRKNSDGSSPAVHGKKSHRSHHSRSDGDLPSSESDVLSSTVGSLNENEQNGDDGGAKIKGASDQPATCPLCGATLRQARNLRRHLEMLHFGAGKLPSDADSPNEAHQGQRSSSRSSSHQSVPASPGAAGTPGSDQSAATVVVMPSSLCQPVMLASPEEAHQSSHHHEQQQHHHQSRTAPNLACVLGPPLLPPPSVATSMMGHHHSQHHFMRYPGHPAELVNRADQQILRGVGIYTDTRLPRPDPGGGMGGTEM